MLALLFEPFDIKHTTRSLPKVSLSLVSSMTLLHYRSKKGLILDHFPSSILGIFCGFHVCCFVPDTISSVSGSNLMSKVQFDDEDWSDEEAGSDEEDDESQVTGQTEESEGKQ